MKKIAISIVIAVCSMVFTSCDLDTYPENKLVNDQALKTMSDLEKFELGTYALFRGNFAAPLIIAGDLQGDYVNAVRGFGNVYGPLHKWDYTYADYEVEDVWQANYKTIAQTNYVLSKDGSISYTDEEKADYDAIMGEMYFIRAMSLFQLIEKFCGDYDPATASKDYSGMPVLKGFNPQEMPSRSSLADTYAQVLSDIAEAKTLLNGTDGKAGAKVLTMDCVTALEARVYLQMHNYDEAYKKAASLIADGVYSLADSADALKTLFTDDAGSEIIFVFYASTNELPADYGAQFVRDQNSKNDYYLPQYIPTQTLVDMYDDADYRKGVYFLKAENSTCEINGNKIATPVYLMNKYPGNPALQTTAGTKNYRNAFKVFRIAEMYLIAAEAGLYAQGGDAKTYLNALRTKRGLSALDNVTLADVKAERTRELMFEGNRISDLKRWGDGISSRKPQTGKIGTGESFGLIESGSMFENLSVTSGDYRFVWPVPSNEIYANQTLASQQNPGWNK